MACEYLLKKGYKILNRNYSNNIGEIDIIARKSDKLIFVEVKTRRSHKFGYGYEAVDHKKAGKIINTSLIFIRDNRLGDLQVAYDLVDIHLDKDVKINHYENIFFN